MTDRIRLFVAATVPPAILEELDGVVAPLKESLSGVRWVPIDNQHVTLKFLGWTGAGDVTSISAACGRVAAAHSPSSLMLTELGAFPSLRRARVLWAGIEDLSETLVSLAHDLDADLTDLGFESEKRSFTPHLTIARFRTPSRLGELPAHASPPSFALDDIVLFESRLHPQGATYSIVERFPLGERKAEGATP